ncbi:MAG: hypothetical protein ACREO3_01675 [Arenimonas sp.]
MNARNPHVIAAALVLLASVLGAPPTMAAADVKSISPMECLPRGPGTTASELTYGPYGITNPGTTNETVICPINVDSDGAWPTTTGSAELFVYHRNGAVPGYVSCTAYVGSGAVSPNATYSESYTAPTTSAYARSYVHLNLAEPGATYSVGPPVSLICTLSPKVSLGWIFFREALVTDTP